MSLNGEKEEGGGVTFHRDVSTHKSSMLNSYFSIKDYKNLKEVYKIQPSRIYVSTKFMCQKRVFHKQYLCHNKKSLFYCF